MARSGTYSSLGTTRTAYFRSLYDYANSNQPTASSGISAPGDGDRCKGFNVSSDIGNSTNVLVYVNGKLSGTLIPGASRDFVAAESYGQPAGGRLEIAAASGTVSGTFGTID